MFKISLSNCNRIYNTTHPLTFPSLSQAGYDIGVAGGLFSKKSFLARFYPDFQASQGVWIYSWAALQAAVWQQQRRCAMGSTSKALID